MVTTVSPLRWLEIVTDERESSRSTFSLLHEFEFLFPFYSSPNLLLHLRTAPNHPLLPSPPPTRTRPFSASDQHPAKNEEEREVGCEGLGIKDGGCSRVQGPRFGDESEQLRKKCASGFRATNQSD